MSLIVASVTGPSLDAASTVLRIRLIHTNVLDWSSRMATASVRSESLRVSYTQSRWRMNTRRSRMFSSLEGSIVLVGTPPDQGSLSWESILWPSDQVGSSLASIFPWGSLSEVLDSFASGKQPKLGESIGGGREEKRAWIASFEPRPDNPAKGRSSAEPKGSRSSASATRRTMLAVSVEHRPRPTPTKN
ncbi:uncharacterized protein BJ171DRAFT_489800 [Polychytrium aggregatum]|uniref:uncharacterized protein n=1 Tax=Polychytrium aggregatum TaxID=110093 RepID=UPI0022FEE15B|nr:uncharacterized protein BJ171DRAFT_489800 [Polychytrium aggregatum]KAI9208732.1 hypothetical protein BJ171DRAFT_489800 [Polychytrium aggregatum]